MVDMMRKPQSEGKRQKKGRSESSERNFGGEEWKCGGGGCKKGQRNSPKRPSPRLTNFLPTFPRQDVDHRGDQKCCYKKFATKWKGTLEETAVMRRRGGKRGAGSSISERSRWTTASRKDGSREEKLSFDRGQRSLGLVALTSSTPHLPSSPLPEAERHREDQWKADQQCGHKGKFQLLK